MGKQHRSFLVASLLPAFLLVSVVAVVQAQQAAKGLGQLPAELDRAAQEVLHPAVDWRSVLREFVSAITPTSPMPARSPPPLYLYPSSTPPYMG